MKTLYLYWLLFLCLTGFSCQTQKSTILNIPQVLEAVGFNGDSLFQTVDAPEIAKKKDSLLQIARQNWEDQPERLENIIWLGRRTAYKSAYKDAIQIYSEGLKKFPDNPELLRHRGHRYLSLRMINHAIHDFQNAVKQVKGLPLKIEPDGIPNKQNIPLSNLQFNIYYHLGLAYYLKNEWEKADSAYATCMRYSNNPDLQVATLDWWYMTKRRKGDLDEAKMLLGLVDNNLEIVENNSYYKRIQFYKGLLAESDLWDVSGSDADQKLTLATQGYGLGNWYYYHGELRKAKEIFEKVIEVGYWSAFGHVAAEADLAHLNSQTY